MVLLKKKFYDGQLHDSNITFIGINYIEEKGVIGKLWNVYPNGSIQSYQKHYWQEGNEHGKLILVLYDHKSGRYFFNKYKFKKFSQGRQMNVIENEEIVYRYNLNFDEYYQPDNL